MRVALQVLLLGAFVSAPAAEEPPQDMEPIQPNPVAQAIISRTNAARQAESRRELTVDYRLNAAAQGLAETMARTGMLSHSADGRTVDQRVEAQQYRWMYVAENIAVRSGDGPLSNDELAAKILQQWIESPGHRQNLLDERPQSIGVATATTADGAIYAVQVFAAPLPE